jgi:hypothetical protein
MKYTIASERALITEIMDPAIADNPAAFVLFAYPWGKGGMPLEAYVGPRTWQHGYLKEMAEHIAAQKNRIAIGFDPEMLKEATASGRGPGKSTLVAWLSDWMVSTRIGSTTIITANTEAQLKSRTFAEMSKWTTMLLNAHWFMTTNLSVVPAPWFKQMVEEQLQISTGYYYVQGQLWSEEKPDAFAGVHNPHGVQVIYDEAAGIPIPIYIITQGFFTEPVLDRYWHTFSNPRRNSGGFYESFQSPGWKTRQIDSRTVEGTDQHLFEEMIEQYGIDSDTVRIEILGQFPKQGNRQFISNGLVYAAQKREIAGDVGAPLIMGCDIARYGDDSTVFRFRQGRDAKSLPPVVIKDRDNMYVAKEIARWIDKVQPDAVNVDAGNGTGVIDRLREMKYRVNEVWFGSKADSKEWADKRTEMWADMRDWLGGGSLDDSPDLFRDFTAPEYDYYGKAQDSVRLEAKESLKARGFPSPDHGDALALTFAVRVPRRDNHLSRGSSRVRIAEGVDYPIFGGDNKGTSRPGQQPRPRNYERGW